MKRFHLRRAFATVPLLSLCAGVAFAQQVVVPQPGLPTQPTVAAPVMDKDDVEVLARGPVHEAYAATAEVPTEGGPIIEKRPPDPVEELPPDQKPDGDNVQWIPGYWQWDEERKDYIWISGFWRNAPPGRVWVPGGWREVRGGYQWVSGFWNVAGTAAKPQAELEYLPPPPESLETGPTIVSPGDDYFYTPGSWIYRTNRYVWRPGFWVEHRRDWLWVPDHYRWTPYGFVFVPGYWDCPLERRGVLFAPVYFRAAVLTRPRFVYTPIYAVPPVSLHTSLFVRRGWGGYYFGDYFEQRYVTAGYSSWAGASFRGSNFAVNVSIGRGFAYDPLWSYYSLSYRNDPRWQANIASVYAGRYKGDIPRPPRTLVQQNTVVNNVTNNTTVIVNNNSNNTTNNRTANAAPTVSPVMLASLADIKKVDPQVAALKAVQADDRVKEQKLAKDIQQVAVERRKVETQLVANGNVAPRPTDKPRAVKMDLPTTVTARAQIPTEPAKAPPPPAVAGAKRVNPVPPKPAVPTPGATTPPKVDPTKPGTPTTPPKVDPPKPGTPVVPKPDPVKPPVTPPVNPLPGTPKPGDPPKQPVTPPTPVKPPVVAPPMPPKVDPPKGPPKTDPPKGPPKTDPPKTPVVQPPVVPVNPPVTTPPAPKPVQPPVMVPTLPNVDPKPVVNPPKPVVPTPAAPPPKVDPPKAPVPVVNPPVNPPKAPAPVVNPPKAPAPVVNPPANPPKAPVTVPPPPKAAAPVFNPPPAPTKPPMTVNPPTTNPRPGPGAPSRPNPTGGEKPKDKKDGKK